MAPKPENPRRKKSFSKIDASINSDSRSYMMNWIIGLTVVLPLLFSSVTIDPLLPIRYIFLSWFILFFLLFFFALKKSRPLFHLSNPLKTVFLLGIAYMLWSFVCTFSAINPSESWFETSRYVLNLVLLFFVMIAAKEEPSQILKLCKALMIAAFIHSVVGILQYYDFAFRDIPGGAVANPNDPNPSWPHGLMANRNLFGSAQVLLLPFIMYVIYKGAKWWKHTGIIILIITIASVVISQTRSAWLAAFALFITVTILIIIFSPPYRKKWIKNIVVGVVSIAVILSLLFTIGAESKLSNSVKMRAYSLVNLSLDNSQSSGRLLTWNKSLQLIKDNPVKGVGPGNWKIAITPYGGKDVLWSSGLVLPSYPHNVYLQVAADTGIPGAILYFSVWILIVLMALRIISKTTSEDIRILIILMLAGLIAFAVDGFFSFPTQRIEHSLYFTIMGGIILSFYANPKTPQKENLSMSIGVLLIMIAVIVFNIFIGYKKYSFEKHTNLAKKHRLNKSFADAIEEAEKAKNNWVTLDAAGEPVEMQSAAVYTELKEYDKALNEIIVAKKYHPNNARIYTTMGVIYANLKDYDKAIESYKYALHLAPEYDVALKNLAGIYFKTGNYAACIKTIEKMESKSYYYIVTLYEEAKKRLGKKQQ